MEYLWITFGIILILGGILGCFIPAIPGPPLAYVSLLLLQLREEGPFTTKFLIIWASIVLVVTILDYVIPPLATKKLGGSRKGVVGSTLGIIAGLFGLLLPWVLGFAIPYWPWVLGVVLVVWALAAPDTLRSVYRVWMRFGLIMSRVTTPIVMGIVFFAVMAPVGLLMRSLGHDPLARKFSANSESYRVESRKPSRENMEKPF